MLWNMFVVLFPRQWLFLSIGMITRQRVATLKTGSLLICETVKKARRKGLLFSSSALEIYVHCTQFYLPFYGLFSKINPFMPLAKQRKVNPGRQIRLPIWEIFILPFFIPTSLKPNKSSFINASRSETVEPNDSIVYKRLEPQSERLASIKLSHNWLKFDLIVLFIVANPPPTPDVYVSVKMIFPISSKLLNWYAIGALNNNYFAWRIRKTMNIWTS